MSIGLSTRELTDIRATIEDLLPGTCDIITVTNTVDGYGGYTTGTSSAGTAACRLDPIKGEEVTAGGEVMPFFRYVLTLPHDTTITTENQVEIDSDIYNVHSIDDNKSYKGSVRVILELT